MINEKHSHAPNDVLGDHYALDRLAGVGGMGEVWLATNVTLDMPVALKVLNRVDGGAADLSTLLGEARATAKLVHPNIVRVYDFGLADAATPFIVMERLQGEDLRDRLVRETSLDPVDAVQLMLPVIHAMHVAHVRGIVHRDLKPENIFLARDEDGAVTPKIVDFGLADLAWLSDEPPISAGTPQYMAPELSRADMRADRRADIWALATVLYEMLAGFTPHATRVAPEIASPEVLYSPLPIDGIDASLWEIVRRGLQPIDERWQTMHAFGAALAEWLIDNDIHEASDGSALEARWLARLAARATPLPSPETPKKRLALTISEAPPPPRRASASWRRVGALLAIGAAASLIGSSYAIASSEHWLGHAHTRVDSDAALGASPRAVPTRPSFGARMP